MCPVDKIQVQEGIHELLEVSMPLDEASAHIDSLSPQSSPLMKSTIVVRSKRLLNSMTKSKKQDMEPTHLNIFIILFQVRLYGSIENQCSNAKVCASVIFYWMTSWTQVHFQSSVKQLCIWTQTCKINYAAI